MIDWEQVVIMMKDIEQYSFDLERMNLSSKKELEEKEKYYALSMVLFAIINRSIDIANEVVMGSHLPIPGSYRDMFDLLAKNKFLSKQTASQMNNLVMYRNMIAHQYHSFDAEHLWQVKRFSLCVKPFIEEIKKLAKK